MYFSHDTFVAFFVSAVVWCLCLTEPMQETRSVLWDASSHIIATSGLSVSTRHLRFTVSLTDSSCCLLTRREFPPVSEFVVSLFSSRKWKRNNSQDPSLPYVKKPPNAFMLYMKEQRPSVVAELVWSDNALVNRILGQRVNLSLV